MGSQLLGGRPAGPGAGREGGAARTRAPGEGPGVSGGGVGNPGAPGSWKAGWEEGAPPVAKAAGERWREQREPVWSEGRVRPRGGREPCLARAAPRPPRPRRERGSLSGLGCR